MKKAIVLYLMLFASIGFSQTVIRGPYMQSPTESSIIIMWRTDVNTSTKVWYGTAPGSLTSFIEINNNVTDHTIQITGLNSYSDYYYAVGSIGGILGGNTPDHRFRTNPVAGTELPIRVWAIGDFGKGNAGQIDVKNSYVNYAGNTHTDVWMWLGDNAYSNGQDAEYQSKVFAHAGFSDIFSWLPFWPTPGNHDYGEVWEQSTWFGIPYSNIPLQDHEGPYFDIVDVPELAEAGGYASNLEVFYSFDYGNVHFVSLNSEVFDYTMTYDGIHEMRDWIIQDLQQNDKTFTIAYFHQPPYSKGSHDSDDPYELVMKAMREEIIPTLEDYDIDLVVCGHSHVFERSFLINGHYGNSSTFNAGTMTMDGSNGNFSLGNAYIKDGLQSTEEGTVYVICGNSGSNETAPALNHPVMIYNAGGDTVMGSFVMDIYKNRLDGKYLTTAGTIADEFTILKQNMAVQPISNITICEGDSTVVPGVFTGGSDTVSYLWQPVASTNSTVTLSPTSTTTYTLTVTDHLTNQVENTTFQVNVLPAPAPVITEVIPDILGSSIGGAGYTYQWYINGNPISGANNQYYTPLFSGTYTVLVTAPNGCSSLSDGFSFTVGSSGIHDFSLSDVNLYPNPTEDIITLEIPGLKTGENYTYSMVDIVGCVLSSGNINNELTQISMVEYKAGYYFIIINHQGKTHSLVFTKI